MIIQQKTAFFKAFLTIFTAVVLLTSPFVKSQPRLTIAVASNFQLPLSQLLNESTRWQANDVRMVVGSSGSLYAQALQGAPFDIVLFADANRAQQLVAQNIALNAQTYAIGKLVIWPSKTSMTANSNNVGAHSKIIAMLEGKGRIAIANPELAPFGFAAQSLLNQLDISSRFENRTVLANNVSQAFQFVDSGNAQVGILAESLLLQAHDALGKSALGKSAFGKSALGKSTLGKQAYLDYWLVPQSMYPPITQQLVILNKSKNKSQAEELAIFLRSEQSQMKLMNMGYQHIRDNTSHD